MEYSGCEYAGLFDAPELEAGGCSSSTSCVSRAQWLDGGIGNLCCRWPEPLVATWSMAATDQNTAMPYPLTRNKKVEVKIAGKTKTVTVNVKDVCGDGDCQNCCKTNTGGYKWRLMDLEKHPASVLLGFDYSSTSFDINNVATPSQGGLRPGAPDGVMALCYRVLGPTDAIP